MIMRLIMANPVVHSLSFLFALVPVHFPFTHVPRLYTALSLQYLSIGFPSALPVVLGATAQPSISPGISHMVCVMISQLHVIL